MGNTSKRKSSNLQPRKYVLKCDLLMKLLTFKHDAALCSMGAVSTSAMHLYFLH